MEQVLERQVVGARSSSWFLSGSVPAEPWHPWGVDAGIVQSAVDLRDWTAFSRCGSGDWISAADGVHQGLVW